MKTLQEFEAFLATDTELNADLGNLETQRKNTKNYTYIIMVIAFIFVAGAGYFMYNQYASTAAQYNTEDASANYMIYIVLAFIGGAFALSYVYTLFIKKKVAQTPTMFGTSSNGFEFDFKDKVVRKMVSFWDPSFRYQINNHIKLSEVYESGMLYEGSYNVNGSDMIRGEIDGVAFRFSDLQILREKKYVGKNEDQYEGVLTGSFFMASFNKDFKNPVYVVPNKSIWTEMSGLRTDGDKVMLEDPDFMKSFDVYATDQVEARYILTPSMMERIKKMRDKMGKNLHITFANNSIYIMNNNGKDRFEASWFKSLNKKENLIVFYNELSEQLSIIEELKLNINIWKG